MLATDDNYERSVDHTDINKIKDFFLQFEFILVMTNGTPMYLYSKQAFAWTRTFTYDVVPIAEQNSTITKRSSTLSYPIIVVASVSDFVSGATAPRFIE